jgi:hypothetical protein
MIYIMYVLKSTKKREGMNPLQVKQNWIQLLVMTLLICTVVVVTSKLGFLYFFVFFLLSYGFGCFLLL